MTYTNCFITLTVVLGLTIFATSVAFSVEGLWQKHGRWVVLFAALFVVCLFMAKIAEPWK